MKNDFSAIDTSSLRRETILRGEKSFKAMEESSIQFIILAAVFNISTIIFLILEFEIISILILSLMVSSYNIFTWIKSLIEMVRLGNEMQARGEELKKRVN